jgi:hypothetical protein
MKHREVETRGHGQPVSTVSSEKSIKNKNAVDD